MRNAFLRKGAPLVALLLAGILLLVFGIHLLRRNVDRYIETTAVLTWVSDSPISHVARVGYAVDGRTFNDIPLEGVATDAAVGDEVVIYYDPDDPSVIESQSGSGSARYCLFFGVLLTAYAGLCIVRSRKTLFVRQVKTDQA
ncbi:MAG: hypothetical protein IKR07_00745 [Oscillospiraceae bacterium]|nr:hypothetical protein [Oscillospiraceae bacterium]